MSSLKQLWSVGGYDSFVNLERLPEIDEKNPPFYAIRAFNNSGKDESKNYTFMILDSKQLADLKDAIEKELVGGK